MNSEEGREKERDKALKRYKKILMYYYYVYIYEEEREREILNSKICRNTNIDRYMVQTISKKISIESKYMYMNFL